VEYFENFGRTLNEEFGDCGTGVAKVTIVYLETFKVTFSEVVNSCSVDGLSNFICVLEQERSEFSGNRSSDRRMQEPVLQGCRSKRQRIFESDITLYRQVLQQKFLRPSWHRFRPWNKLARNHNVDADGQVK